MIIDKFEVGQRIRNIRSNLNLSMKEFAVVIDSKKSTVNSWERGLSIPKLDMLEKIAVLGNLSVNELLYGDLENYVKELIHFYLKDDVEISNENKTTIYNLKPIFLKEKNIHEIVNLINKSEYSYQDEMKILSTIKNYIEKLTEDRTLSHMLGIYEYEREMTSKEVAKLLDIPLKEYLNIKDGSIKLSFEEIKNMEKTLEVPPNFFQNLNKIKYLSKNNNSIFTEEDYKKGIEVVYEVNSRKELEILQILTRLDDKQFDLVLEEIEKISN